ncbi:hypothetical protein jhhlp_004390 [Lomentospora prolificans]|uniref:Uncharacterized protein n=1 Tax=Lomentospora prolificans TaxID=41688 RepID=A0A2N3NBG0_9PEZI|nr:hypothetical protein jhhlp_004390 [Lomentospora prolificans]
MFAESSIVAMSLETSQELCEALTAFVNTDANGTGHEIFSWLYCCDSVVCGVWYNGSADIFGQDPNVNKIISECGGIGYPDLEDPGVPSFDFVCPDSSVYKPGERRACSAKFDAAELKTLSVSEIAATSSSIKPTHPLGTVPRPSTSLTTFPEESLTSSGDSPSMSPQPQQPGLTSGVKATIAITSIVGLLAILSMILCLHRRRKRPLTPNQYPYGLRPRTKLSGAGTATNPSSFDSSPTRLVSLPNASVEIVRTGRNGPLSPPPRLKDRKLLPTFVNATRKPPNQRLIRSPSNTFPTSPLCAPTTSKLEPRLEYGPHSGPRPARFQRETPGTPPFISRRGASISGSASTSTSSQIGATLTSGTPPSSPTRPPRPHEAPLEIPDLITPSTAPRPSWGLPPPTPPPPPVPPREIVMALSHSDESSAQKISSESRDLCGLTEECTREERESWGMFPTAEGAPSLSSREGGVVSPILGERELERMGGKYR